MVLPDVRDPGFCHLVALPYVGPGCQYTSPWQQDRGTLKTFKEGAWVLPRDIPADIP